MKICIWLRHIFPVPLSDAGTLDADKDPHTCFEKTMFEDGMNRNGKLYSFYNELTCRMPMRRPTNAVHSPPHQGLDSLDSHSTKEDPSNFHTFMGYSGRRLESRTQLTRCPFPEFPQSMGIKRIIFSIL
mmetsp:Transcript_17781/g.36893  ORF Transcript_17781/g.36893 Transcript_17781/m.36893 type:complete len:129 (-) Transcript_17781:153-539(-)